MPYQNRVTPRGEIIRSSDRGLLMGNRGCLHNSERQIVRASKIVHWVTCLLQFKNQRRKLMTPGKYTELFFLDEATALAAGHRPCATCQNARYKRFKKLWFQANGVSDSDRTIMDRQLHSERLDAEGQKVTFEADLASLPDGTFIERDNQSLLVWGENLLRWSTAGYVAAEVRPSNGVVRVLTPRSIVEVLRLGYVAQHDLHPTATQLR